MNKVHSADMEKEQIVCRHCDRKLLNEHGLISHMSRMHEKDFFGKFEFYECDYDGKIFKEKTKLNNHMAKHKLRVRCEICNVEIQSNNLNQHVREVHTDDRKLPCQHCQKSFKSVHKLKVHIQTHNKSVKCPMCPKLFPLKGSLNQHIKQFHENPGSFECESCGKKFNKKGILQSHQKIHDKNRPKPFKCQRCDYATDGRQSFKRHQKSHEHQDKKFAAIKDPIKCKKCSKFIRNKDGLRQHMRHVHPDVPYQCDLCGVYVKSKYSLKKHFLMHLKKQLNKN
jgi:KRAB domain-containing zinc finger protein